MRLNLALIYQSIFFFFGINSFKKAIFYNSTWKSIMGLSSIKRLEIFFMKTRKISKWDPFKGEYKS